MQNLFSFEKIQRKISPFRKVYIHSLFYSIDWTF